MQNANGNQVNLDSITGFQSLPSFWDAVPNVNVKMHSPWSSL